MALRNYQCKDCEHIELYFDHEDRICKCGSVQLERKLSIPLQSRNTDVVDKYHNINASKGVQDDLKSRTMQHNQDNLDDAIADRGEKHAKEMGWIVYDKAKKKWRKRENWDIDLLNKTNSGSKEQLAKVTKK